MHVQAGIVPNKLVVAGNSIKAGHQLSIRDVTVLARTVCCMDCIVKEAIKMWLCLYKLNRDMGFTL
jgi:hypothetical protein